MGLPGSSRIYDRSSISWGVRYQQLILSFHTMQVLPWCMQFATDRQHLTPTVLLSARLRMHREYDLHMHQINLQCSFRFSAFIVNFFLLLLLVVRPRSFARSMLNSVVIVTKHQQ